MKFPKYKLRDYDGDGKITWRDGLFAALGAALSYLLSGWL